MNQQGDLNEQNQPVEETKLPRKERRLHRSTNNRMIAGALGGIAVTYDWDSSLVRIAFVLASLLTAFAIPVIPVLVYVVLWLLMPRG